MQKKEISEKTRQHALKTSLKQAATGDTSTSIGELYAVPFAKEIGSAPFLVGVLTALTGIATPLAQVYGSSLLQHLSRKRLVLRFSFIQALLWIPVIALTLSYYFGFFVAATPFLFIFFYTLLVAVGNIAFPAWFSWLGDLINKNERGKYFSTRNRIIGSLGLVIVLAGASIIDVFKTRGMLLIGFTLLFTLAGALRFAAFFFMKRQYAPLFNAQLQKRISFWTFIKSKDQVSTFAIYLALFNGALMIASPFFALYMLQDLKFSYFTLMAVTLSSTVFYLLFTPLAGHFSDRYGNVRLLRIANLFFMLSPLCWLFIKNPLLLIGVSQLVAGIANAALAMAATNFLYDAVPAQRRPFSVAYTNILAGIGIFLGALLGGVIVSTLHPSSLNPYLFLFAISALLRGIVGFGFLPSLKEVKKTSPLPLFSLNVFHPVRTFHDDTTWVKRVLKGA